MALYEAKCNQCSIKIEYLRSYQKREETPLCPRCLLQTERVISAPAFTPSVWGDSQWQGRYDRGLGVVLKDKAHRDRLMQERGLYEATLSDTDNSFDRMISEGQEHERQMALYNHNLREANGDTGLAIANTFPGEE